MERNQKVSMEKNEKTAAVEEVDEPEINYRGIKAMPYIIGLMREKIPNLSIGYDSRNPLFFGGVLGSSQELAVSIV